MSHPIFVDSIVGKIAVRENWRFIVNTDNDNGDVWEVTYNNPSRDEFIDVEYRFNFSSGGTYLSKVKHRFLNSPNFYSSEAAKVEDNVKLLGLVTLWLCS